MAALGKIIDGSKPPEQSYDAIPAGWYRARITQAEQKPTSTGGVRLSVRFDITGPSAQGRALFDGFNIRNANPKAEEIALSQLQALAHACGIAKLTDDQQLLNKECEIKVTVKNDPERGSQNEIKGYKPSGNSFAPGGAQPAPFQPQAQPSWQPQTVATGGAATGQAAPAHGFRDTSPSAASPPWARQAIAPNEVPS